jgi:hypothetical protein
MKGTCDGMGFFRKTIELEIEKRVGELFIGLWKINNWTFWKVWPPPKLNTAAYSIQARNVGAPATLGRKEEK